MQEVEQGPDGRPWFVGFEWTGANDYLNEAVPGRHLKRGSNSTSTDAFVRFIHNGKLEALLIEWKYTESYGAPLADRSDGVTGGNATRRKRYEKLVFAPDGPIKPADGISLNDFFYEPFYQLLRQQMLAYQMEKHGEASRVRVLHISPTGNSALHKVTSPALRPRGTDAFDVFRSLLVQPDRFVSRSTASVFGTALAGAGPDDPWASYLLSRYKFISDPDPKSAP